MEYREFLEGKIKLSEMHGFGCEPDEINPILKPHQRDIVQWAVRGGKRAIFAAFGLGKSVIQIETLRILGEKLGGGKLLIVCPWAFARSSSATAACSMSSLISSAPMPRSTVPAST